MSAAGGDLVEDAQLGLAEAGAALSQLDDDVDREQVAEAEWALLSALGRIRMLKGRAEA